MILNQISGTTMFGQMKIPVIADLPPKKYGIKAMTVTTMVSSGIKCLS